MSTANLAGHLHVFERSASPTRRVLLMLHGTGGDEHDLLPLGRMLDPEAHLLSPRGNVLEHGAPRFFRRLAEGVFDQEDLRARTTALAGFVREAVDQYRVADCEVVAVGFSNGANIAASVLLAYPGVFAGAVLFRAMVPFEPESPPELGGTRVFLSAGRQDQMVRPEETERLAVLLRNAGASVELHWAPAGHNLTQGDVDQARAWLAASASGAG